MADVKILAAFIKSWEGGFSNDKDDKGGATMCGVTINTYTQYCRKKGKPAPTVADLMRISEEEWFDILKTLYWDPWKADEIKSQAVANICVNWGWGAGTVSAIKAVQSAFGLKPDGVVGPMTLAALNKFNKQYEYRFVFNRIKAERAQQLLTAAKSANNSKYIDGWLRRWEAFGYDRLVKARGGEITW